LDIDVFAGAITSAADEDIAVRRLLCMLVFLSLLLLVVKFFVVILNLNKKN